MNTSFAHCSLRLRVNIIGVLAFSAAGFLPFAAQAEPPLPGAIFTSGAPLGGVCQGVNLNIYDLKTDVYLNGGPDHPGSAGLMPNTSYYVKVTSPSGATPLGSSVGTTNPKPVLTNALGNFTQCLQLWEIVKSTAWNPGYDNTPNPGGEYKVWVSTVSTFDNNSTKTDNFKVKEGTTPPCDPTVPGTICPPAVGSIEIHKYYDAAANCTLVPAAELTGWKVDLIGSAPKNTVALFDALPFDDYTAREYAPIESNWYSTCPTPVSGNLAILNKTGATITASSPSAVVNFGNVCTGPGGGLTLGFWSNKNGQSLFNGGDLAFLVSPTNLRNWDGAIFDPSSYANYKSWLLKATATNMAYMLSAQMSAMILNVRHAADSVPFGGGVVSSALIYAPGTNSANLAGFAMLSAVLAEANDELAQHGLVLSGSPYRYYQQNLKNALDNANNNVNFVQSSACPRTFTNPVVVQ